MRLLLCEFVTAGGFGRGPVPDSLAREGDAMLRGLVKDLTALGGHRLTVLRDHRLAPMEPAATTVPVAPDEGLWRRLAAALEDCDAFWPIAPESDGALERMTRGAVSAGRRVIGSSAEAVALAASKLATCLRLRAAGVASVATWPDLQAAGGHPGPWVVKPDDGAGCAETSRFEARAELEAFFTGRPDAGRFVVQPWIAGEAVSLSLLCRDGRARLLACNSQELGLESGKLTYRGGVVGALERRRGAFEAVAAGVAASIPGLWGLVGVDLIDATEGPLVVDVNPRLTTSYGALGAALGVNPAALVLALLERPLDPSIPPLVVTPVAIPGFGECG